MPIDYSPLSQIGQSFYAGQEQALRVQGERIQNQRALLALQGEQQRQESQKQYMQDASPELEALSAADTAIMNDPKLNPQQRIMQQSQQEVQTLAKLSQIAAKDNNWDAYKENQDKMITALDKLVGTRSDMRKEDMAKAQQFSALATPFYAAKEVTPELQQEYNTIRPLLVPLATDPSQLPPTLATQQDLFKIKALATQGLTGSAILAHMDRQEGRQWDKAKFDVTMQQRRTEESHREADRSARRAQAAQTGQWRGDPTHKVLDAASTAAPSARDVGALNRIFQNSGFSPEQAKTMAEAAAEDISLEASKDLDAYETDRTAPRSRAEWIRAAANAAMDEDTTQEKGFFGGSTPTLRKGSLSERPPRERRTALPQARSAAPKVDPTQARTEAAQVIKQHPEIRDKVIARLKEAGVDTSGL